MLVQDHHRRGGGTALACASARFLRMTFLQEPAGDKRFGPSLSTPGRIDCSSEVALTIGRMASIIKQHVQWANICRPAQRQMN
jgi:hypothetical protein